MEGAREIPEPVELYHKNFNSIKKLNQLIQGWEVPRLEIVLAPLIISVAQQPVLKTKV